MESRRITGTEMEWAPMVSCSETSMRQLTHNEMNPHVEREVKELQIGFHGHPAAYYLANGARFYSDLNDHREYATPEDDSFMGTYANELAGERIMANSMRHYEEETGQKVSLVKRVIDDGAESSGYHISYAADATRMSINEDDLELFGVFAATRNVLFGSGALLMNGNFILGQKVHTLGSSFNASTTIHKPVVNLRNRPLSDKDRFLRVHDTSSDPNAGPWATRVKLAAGSITLKLIEQDRRIDNLRFADSILSVAKAVGQDLTLQRRYKMAYGGGMTALEVLSRIVKEARKLEDCNDEELWALDEQERAIYDLQKDPRRAIKRVEWLLRLKMLERAKERGEKEHGEFEWTNQSLRYKNRQFSEMMGEESVAKKYRESIWSDYMPPESMIEDRILSPPQTTRASLRGRFIDYAHMNGTPAKSVTWQRIEYQGRPYNLDDPFLATNHDLEELINKDLSEAIPA